MAFHREPGMSLVGRLQREARFLPCVAITGRSLRVLRLDATAEKSAQGFKSSRESPNPESCGAGEKGLNRKAAKLGSP